MNNHTLALKTASYLVPLVLKGEPPISYSQLARHLGINPREVGGILGYMRDKILGDRYPLLNVMVVYKKRKVPGSGWLQPRPQNLSKERERQLFLGELEKVYSYENWPHLLNELGLFSESSSADKDLLGLADEYIKKMRKLGKKREGKWHMALKEYIRKHPEVLGLPTSSVGYIERAFRSGDEADVVFHIGSNWWAVVEVKDGKEIGELIKGVFQAVKYKALLEAERKYLGQKAIVSAFLVSYKESSEIEEIALKLSVKCIQIAKVRVLNTK